MLGRFLRKTWSESMTAKKSLLAGLFVLFILFFTCTTTKTTFQSYWPENTTRYWIGPEYWSNRLQDWRIHDGRLECIDGTRPIRTVHVLTYQLGEQKGTLEMSVRTGRMHDQVSLSENEWSGFLIGAGDLDLDYRARAIIHQATGKNGGLVAAFNGKGETVFLDMEKDLEQITPLAQKGNPTPRSVNEDVVLHLKMEPTGNGYVLTLTAKDFRTGQLLHESTVKIKNSSRLTGNLALAANGGAHQEKASFWFRDWSISGSKLEYHPEQRFGPILNAMYTLSNKILKLTAQLPPVSETDPQTIRLEVTEKDNNQWKKIGEAKLIVPGWTATFRIPDWDDSKNYQYRLVYSLPDKKGKLHDYYLEGTIRKNPVEKDEIVVAAFTGNSNTFGSFGKKYEFNRNRLWFPHTELVSYVKKHQPDLLVYTGDQVYESRPTVPDRSGELSSYLDYLYKWYMFCWAHGELTRYIPAVCLPDDHDVYHGNIWGAGGIKARDLPKDGKYPPQYRGLAGHWRQDGGGYIMPADFVNMVQRTQTSHLPDPYDPTPVAQGITVYYTSMNYGGISFAILEDRKFKSAPSVMIPEGQVVNGFLQNPNFDPLKTDVPGAKLLGDRQLKFLNDWATDWSKGVQMKIALSQTIFANVSTYPADFKTDAGTPKLKPLPAGVIPKGYKMAVDMDSNGWPQTGRNKALAELRRGFAFHIAGDQHLGSIVHHGIDDWDDAIWSFCVPSIANLWPRRWYPPYPGKNRQPGMPAYTGQFKDGFGNKITVWAVSNPVISNHEPANLYDRAPGYGIVRLNKRDMTITVECWPRWEDPAKPDAKQYPGWPKTISVYDNYARKPRAYLPTLEFTGIKRPVVKVIDENSGEVIYAVRIKEQSFRPKVFKPGVYTIEVGEPGTDKIKVFTHLSTYGSDEHRTLKVEF